MTALKFVFLVFLSQVMSCSTNDKSGNPSKDSSIATSQVSPSSTNSDSTPALKRAESPGNSGTVSSSKLTYTIIPSEENTFGYDIYMEGKMMVHQPSIPGLPGNKGFDTKEQAEKVAKLVIEKIDRGEMPPTVTTEELKNLGIEAKK